MFDLTQKELDNMSYAEICALVLTQQKLLKQCNDVLGQAMETLNKVKEIMQ